MPATIQYANDLLCNSPEIKTLTLAEFERMVSEKRGVEFKWADGLITSDGHELPTFMDGFDPAIVDKLVVCNMGPLGFGVFAKSLIPKGTPIACYSGVITKATEGIDIYLMTLKEGEYVTARQRGNLAGFFQHIGVISEYKQTVEEMAVSNLSQSKSPDGGLWFTAMCDIQPNEQLGYPYDVDLRSYWMGLKCLPKHFDPVGRVLPYNGAIFTAQTYPLLINLGVYLNDTKQLAHLEKIQPKIYNDHINRLSKFTGERLQLELVNNMFSTILVNHIDLLRVLYPEHRKALLGIFTKLRPIMDPKGLHSDSPYAKNRGVEFVKWAEIPSSGFFIDPHLRAASLQIPTDFFKIVNPLRYYAYQDHSDPSKLETQIKDLYALGLKDFKSDKFADAAHHWEHALQLARDYKFSRPSEADSAEKYITVNRGDGKENFIRFDDRIRSLCWNLGNAYTKAAEVEELMYKSTYLREAEYCITIAIEMVKASNNTIQEASLAKYETRLNEVQTAMRVGHALDTAGSAGSGGASGCAAGAGR